MNGLSSVEFLRGLLSQLAVDGYPVIPFKDKTKFHKALVRLSIWLRRNAEKFEVEPDFHFVENQVNRSSAVRLALSVLVHEQLLLVEGKGWDALRYNSHSDYAQFQVNKTPGGSRLFSAAAREFLTHYPMTKPVEAETSEE